MQVCNLELQPTEIPKVCIEMSHFQVTKSIFFITLHFSTYYKITLKTITMQV